MGMLTLMAHEVGIKPRFDLNWGLGFDFTKRITQSFPRDASARRIIIDFSSGGTSNVGLLYKTNTIAAGLALMRANTADRLLFAGGTTITGIAVGNIGGKGGISRAVPTMLGTYDPSDPNNEAKDNTLRTLFDMSTVTTPDCWIPAFTSFNGAIIFIGSNANSKYYVIRNLDFSCDPVGCFGKQAFFGFSGGGTAAHDGVLIENCTFLNLIVNSSTGGQTSPIASSADSTFSLDMTIRKCGLYGAIGVNAGGLGLNGQRRLKLHDNILCRGGRPSYAGRSAVDSGANTPAFTSALGATSVGNLVTVNDTSTMLVGDRVSTDTSSGGTGAFWAPGGIVMTIPSSTTFTVDTTPLTTLAGCIVKSYHVGGDLLRHHYYIDSNTNGIEILRNVSMLENVNNKFTGGDYNIEAHWHIWEPIGFLTDPNSNDATGNSWPTGSVMYANGVTQIGADDVQYNSLQRGWGDFLGACANGSRITNSLYINQNNPNTGNRQGLQITANGRAYQSYGQVDNSIFVGWGANDNTAVVSTIKSWINNVTDDAAGYLNTTNGSGSSMSSGSGNVNRTALGNAAINNLINLTIEDTFRVSNVLTNTAAVVNANATIADRQATIRNMGALMTSPAGLAYNWAEEMAQAIRRPSGH